MNNSLVSVIVPVYNTEQYIDDCMQSLFHQTYSNMEIKLIDDGSVEASAGVCDRYAVINPRIVVYHQKNMGVSNARNKGIEDSNGRYICFLDADDKWETNYLEKMTENITDGVLPLCSFLRLNGKKVVSSMGDLDFHGIINRPTQGLYNCWRGIFQKNIVDEHQLYFKVNRKTGEDLEFLYKYALFCNYAIAVPEAKYIYRCNPNSTMYSANYAHFDAVDAMLETVEYAEKNGNIEKGQQYREDLLYYNAIRTIEFAVTTVLTGGEPAKKVLQFIRDKGYDKLITEAMNQPNHYYSTFYKLYTVSPWLCFEIISVRKAVGRILRRFKILR